MADNVMLAGSAPADLSQLGFPLLASPKLDGVRAIIRGGVVLSRALKPIPNQHVQALLALDAFDGLDGELIVGDECDPACFRTTMSAVMSDDVRCNVRFHAFDCLGVRAGFDERLCLIERLVKDNVKYSKRFTVVRHDLIKDVAALDRYEEKMVNLGYEGVMLRDPHGPYKHGRSTANEGYLLKLKRFEDSEAVVVGFTALQSNQNAAITDATGHQARSSHQAGMVAQPLLGALQVVDVKTEVAFDLGVGFTMDERHRLWKQRAALVNRLVKYKHQPHGRKTKPRLPVFLGFRDKRDL